MLPDIDKIPWHSLEHAYGKADDIPDLLRALVSEDETLRKHAQHMLYIGPFHQDTVTSCLPYVARMLISLLSYPNTPDKPWIITYLARTAGACDKCITVDMSTIPTVFRASLSVSAVEEVGVEKQLCDELRQGIPLFHMLLSSGTPAERQAVPALLVRLNCKDPQLQELLFHRLQQEKEAKTRAILVYCFAQTCTETDTLRLGYLAHLLQSEEEEVVVRLAAGFGMINVYRQQNSQTTLHTLEKLMLNHPDLVLLLDAWHSAELVNLTRVWPHLRLLDSLRLLNNEQQSRLLDVVEKLGSYIDQRNLPGGGYVDGLLKILQHALG
jgi:hypothetical protein